MSSYFLSIISSFISIFLTCYFIYWIVSLFKSVKGPKIAFILITLDVICHLIYPIQMLFSLDTIIEENRKNGYMVTTDDVIQLYLFFIADIIVVVSAYLTFIYLFYAKNFVFKSGRAKQFEREYSGKSNVVLNISRVLFLFFALIVLTIAIIIFATSPTKYTILIGLILIVISLFLTYLFIRTFIGTKKGVKVKTKQEKINDYYFIVITDYDTYLYEGNSSLSFKEALNGMDENYYIDEYGYITGHVKKVVYGIRISNISVDELNNLKMEKVNNDKLIDILSSLDKVHQKVIKVDENFNVISEENR